MRVYASQIHDGEMSEKKKIAHISEYRHNNIIIRIPYGLYTVYRYLYYIWCHVAITQAPRVHAV